MPITLSSIAAALGELEPPGETDNMGAEHCARVRALQAVAPFIAITSAADAALALSLVAEILGGVSDNSEEEMREELARGTAIIARVTRWLMETPGVQPLKAWWAEEITPFRPLGEAAE